MRNWSLDALIRPHTAEAFFAAHHEKHRLLVHRDDPRYFAELLTLDDVDRILTTLEARYAEINLVDADREIALADYVNADDTINIDRLFQLHASGATVILNHLHRRHPPLADLCGALELEFSAPVQTNIYLTPPQDKGFKAHFDTHDVFVLQLTGTKAWRLYDTPIALPLRGHGNEAAREDFGTPSETFELRPGDTLYIPRGLVHDADATDEPSLHITVGILAWTWFDFLLDAVAELAATEEKARAALPPGFADPHFDRSAARETFGNFVDLLATRVDIDRLFDLSIETFIDRRRLPLRGGLA
ncbi:MAG: hypothetical protein KDJ16_07835, partial [Hyphomicrobiales bacterium]|nr:hypothetical protein [Hyphomicrobiales bacterium]